MKKLPPITGLLAEIRTNRRDAARQATIARNERSCPREAHDCAERADKLAERADGLEVWASEDGDIITQLNATADFLRISKHTSPLRALALRKIEDAEMILRREIGDDPGELKP
jgi:hypothetical protein